VLVLESLEPERAQLGISHAGATCVIGNMTRPSCCSSYHGMPSTSVTSTSPRNKPRHFAAHRHTTDGPTFSSSSSIQAMPVQRPLSSTHNLSLCTLYVDSSDRLGLG